MKSKILLELSQNQIKEKQTIYIRVILSQCHHRLNKQSKEPTNNYTKYLAAGTIDNDENIIFKPSKMARFEHSNVEYIICKKILFN